MNQPVALSVCVTKRIPLKYVVRLVAAFQKQKLTFGVIRTPGTRVYQYEIWREPKEDERVAGGKNKGGTHYNDIIERNPPRLNQFWHIWYKGEINDGLIGG